MFGGVNTEETFSLKTIINTHPSYYLNLILELNILITHDYWDFSRQFTKADVQFTIYFSRELDIQLPQAEKKGLF